MERADELAAFLVTASDAYGLLPARCTPSGSPTARTWPQHLLLTHPEALAGAILIARAVPRSPRLPRPT
jgi:hypothetical protein